MKIAVFTLGCKANQFESQAIEKKAIKNGHIIVPFGENCDACVINTCTVTGTSGKKSRQIIRKARKLYPAAIIAVCGCFSQLEPDTAVALGADVILGADNRLSIIEHIENKDYRPFIIPSKDIESYEIMSAGNLSGRTRAYLKIQDGCDNYCTYCIIPYARGKSRSAPFSFLLDEAKRLISEGFLEIIVTGIEISSYKDGNIDFTRLIAELCLLSDNTRIRLGSLEPASITEDFCKTINNKNLCRHFHLSIQSGCDNILRRMGRRYDTKTVYNAINLLRSYFPDAAICADLIIGFPGETDAEFEETLRFIEGCKLSHTHIFPYSKRPGTPAFSMPDQILRETKLTRAARASAVAQKMEYDYNMSLIGRELEVLCEEENKGHSSQNTLVYFKEPARSGELIRLKAVRPYKNGLLGERI